MFGIEQIIHDLFAFDDYFVSIGQMRLCVFLLDLIRFKTSYCQPAIGYWIKFEFSWRRYVAGIFSDWESRRDKLKGTSGNCFAGLS